MGKVKLMNLELGSITLEGQCEKVSEEIKELNGALCNHLMEDNSEHVIEEFWDVVQAYEGLLHKLDIDATDIMNGYPKHLEKMKSRPRKK